MHHNLLHKPCMVLLPIISGYYFYCIKSLKSKGGIGYKKGKSLFDVIKAQYILDVITFTGILLVYLRHQDIEFWIGQQKNKYNR